MADRHTIHSVASAGRRFLGRRHVASAVAASAVIMLEVARVFVLQPLHARGVAQGLLSVPLSLSWILLVPGNRLLALIARVPSLSRPLARLDGWHVFLVLSFLFYFATFEMLGATNRWIDRKIERRARRSVGAEGPPPERHSRRQFLRGAKATASTVVVAAGAYPLFVEPHRLEVTRRSFPVKGLPASLEGLRIVQLTDIHLGPWTSLGRVRRIVDEANALEADLVALTGDYVLRSPEYIPQVASALAALRGTIGVVGVLGNHDWNQGAALSTRELIRAGVRMLDNDRLYVTPARGLSDNAGVGLCIAGVGDLWNDRQLYDRALSDVPAGVPRLLLSHNPDVAEERAFISSGYRVDLMLSGHTHGGQVVLPGVGAAVTMSRYGQKYARGLVRGPTCPVFVSRGLGTAMLPVRVGSTPEIAVIELMAASEPAMTDRQNSDR